MGNRRKGRECALQILYNIEIIAKPEKNATSGATASGTNDMKDLSQAKVGKAIDDFFGHFEAPYDVLSYASSLVRGTLINLVQIDQLIENNSKKWKIGRMGSIDRNVLRIATYELLFSPELTPGIIIDEAIEVARKYGSENSASFVNGILDTISKEKEKAATKEGS